MSIWIPDPPNPLIPWAGNYVPVSLLTNQLVGHDSNKQQAIVVDILWNTTIYNNFRSIIFDASTRTQKPNIDQIACLWVDNSWCSVPIIIKFPDTNFTLHIDAWEAGRVYPVITNALQFYIWQPSSEWTISSAGYSMNDVTNIIVCDSNIPPVIRERRKFASESFGLSTSMAAGTITIANNAIPPNFPFILKSLSISAENTAASGNLTEVSIIADGNTIIGPIFIDVVANTTLLYNSDGWYKPFLVLQVNQVIVGVPTGRINIQTIAESPNWGT